LTLRAIRNNHMVDKIHTREGERNRSASKVVATN
jgi:hypothetical protein